MLRTACLVLYDIRGKCVIYQVALLTQVPQYGFVGFDQIPMTSCFQVVSYRQPGAKRSLKTRVLAMLPYYYG